MKRQFQLWTLVLLLTGSLAVFGCGKSVDGPAKDKTPDVAHDDHAHNHAEAGPHHGHLIELGEEEFHAELVHDDVAGKVTIYLLDKTAKESASADNEQVTLSVLIEGQPKEFVMQATDAAKRDQFESSEKDLVEALDHDKTAKGRLHVTIGNKPFVGTIEHEKHEDHDHKHK